MAGKSISADVVVIGTGLAGAAAALAARGRGKQVCVIAAGRGASAMSSGALDLCGDPRFVPGRPERTCTDIAENISELLARNPDHPYGLLTDSKDPAAAVGELFRRSMDVLFPAKEMKYLDGSFERSRPYLTSLGTFKFSAFAHSSAAELDDHALERSVVIGFNELAGFDPDYWLSAAKENAGKMGMSLEAVRAIRVGLGLGEDMSTLELAGRLEHAGCAETFVEKIAGSRESFEHASAAIIPAVLPFSRRDNILRDLKEKTGLEFRELISLPPSVPGMRLARHMKMGLERQSVKIVSGRVTGFRAEGGKIVSLSVDSLGGLNVEGSSYILAAGGFIGGGLKKDPHFREPVFNLPVFSNNEVVKEIFTEKMTELSIRGPHRLFSAGIKADLELRPLDGEGRPAFKNLRVAGSIIAAGNYLADGTGAGVALTTGYRAGSM